MIFLNQEFTGQTNSAMCILRFGNHDIQYINIFVPFKNISQIFATDLHIIFLFRKKTQTYASGKIKKVDESTYAHTLLLYHKITKKSITIQAMFVSLSRSKVLSSLALVVYFRVELCQIRGPIIKKHPNGVFFILNGSLVK